ncbi:MAG: N-6 DNA methylase [Patescibacteria group bacterium]|nr:N-6 DNA methylase [Patescibacteria group bacterium]
MKGAATLGQYDLGCKWKRHPATGDFSKTTTLHDDQPPHLLFLERCLQLLKRGGRLGIVLPESILGNPSYEHIVTFIMQRTTIRVAVTMPEVLFKTSGKGGTHTKVCILVLENKSPTGPHDIFMADAKWCGHDSRGNPTIRKDERGAYRLLDEVPEVTEAYHAFCSGKVRAPDHKGFVLSSGAIRGRILVPKYYDPEIDGYLKKLRRTHKLLEIGSLVNRGVVTLSTGTEIGKMAYGTGRIPFIRTSDLSNWEMKADFKHGVSEAIYEAYRKACDVRAGDILMVRDGTYLIGTTAIVTESDLPMLFQSHILRIRVQQPDELDPWLLFAALNTPIVRRQVKAKQFTQDIIDTLGKRIREIQIPLPKSDSERKRLAREIREAVETRIKLRNQATAIAMAVEGLVTPKPPPDVALLLDDGAT